MPCSRARRILALLIPLLAATVSAAEGDPPVVTRVLPAGATLDSASLAAAPVALPQPEFLRLQAAAAAARRGPRRHAALSPVQGRLVVPAGDEAARLELTRTVLAEGAGPIPVEVAPAGAVLLSLQVRPEGGAAERPAVRVGADGALIWLAPGPGRYQLEMSLAAPRRGLGFAVLGWPGPGGALQVVGAPIQLVDGGLEPVAEGADLVLPSGAPFRFRTGRGEAAPEAGGAQPDPARPSPAAAAEVRLAPARPVASWEVLAEPEHDRVPVVAALALTQPGVGADELRLLLPPGARPRAVEGALVASWEARPAGGGRELVVRLTRPLQGRAGFELGYDLEVPEGGGRVAVPVPRLVAALRERAYLAVAPRDAIQVEGEGAVLTELVAITPADLPESLRSRARAPVLAAYRGVAPGAVSSLLVRPLAAAPRTTMVVQGVNGLTVVAPGDDGAGGARLSLISKVVLRLQNTAHRYLDVSLPAGAEVISCAVARRPVAPLEDPEAPGRLRIPVPRSASGRDGPEPVPVQLSYRVERPGGLGPGGQLELPLPVVHAPVVDTSWKVYSPETIQVRAFTGDLRWEDAGRRFAPVELTSLLLEEVVLPAVQTLLALLLLAGLGAAVRTRNSRAALAAFGRAVASRLFALVTVVVVLGVMAAIAVPNFQAARSRSNVRACFANQKTIAGAVEMYNLDFNTDISDLRGVWDALKDNGYLQSLPNDPGAGAHSHGNYRFDEGSANGITCLHHGPIQRSASTLVSMKPLASRPQGSRAAPADVAIPVTGTESLLERGFLEAGRAAAVRLDYLGQARLAGLEAAASVLGLLLALAACLLLTAARAPVVLGLGLLAGALAADGVAPRVAFAFVGAGGGTALALAFLGLLRRTPEWARRLLARGTAPAASATALLLGLGGLAQAARPVEPIETLRLPGVAEAGEVLVTRASYDRLVAEARPETPWVAAPGTRLTARVEADDQEAAVALELEVLPTTEWFRLLPREGAALVGARGPHGPWPLEARGADWWAAPMPEGGALHLELRVTRSRGARGATATVPVPVAAQGTLEVAGAHEGRVLVGGVPWSGARAFAPGAPLEILWEKPATHRARVAAVAPPAPRTDLDVDARYLVEVGLRDARAWGRLGVTLKGTPSATLTLSLPPHWTALEVRGPQLADWEQRPGGELRVVFARPVTGRVDLEAGFELPREVPERVALALPFVPGATRELRRVAVAAPPDRILELRSPRREEARDSQPAPLAGFTPEELADVQAYASLPAEARHETLEIAVRSLDAVAIHEASVDVMRLRGVLSGDGRLLLEGRLSVKNARNQFLRVRFPPGTHLYATRVAGLPVRAAQGEDGEVLVPLARSRVVDGSLEPFSVTWTAGLDTQASGGGDPGRVRLVLPHLDLPVGSMRLSLGVPRGLRLDVSHATASAESRDRGVGYTEAAVPAPGGDAVVLEVGGEGPAHHFSRELLRPSDAPVLVEGLLVQVRRERPRLLVAFGLGFLGTLLLLAALAGVLPDSTRLGGAGAVVVLGLAVTSGGWTAAAVHAAVGAFDAWLLHGAVHLVRAVPAAPEG